MLAAHQAPCPGPGPGSFPKLLSLLKEGWSRASPAVGPHRGPHSSLSLRWGTGPHSLPGTEVPRSPYSWERRALRVLLTTAPRKLSRGAKTALPRLLEASPSSSFQESRTQVMEASGARPSRTRHRKPCRLTYAELTAKSAPSAGGSGHSGLGRELSKLCSSRQIGTRRLEEAPTPRNGRRAPKAKASHSASKEWLVSRQALLFVFKT